ncbi:hypothetical protein GYMLUDRAFT_736406 [Collybiopsis luxurians FD-317 M1]|uniref:Uncharacterized protein n=1 Tax=Collybiopsis luxurians FD-317 M1 TaxID=944289 RepID=A0A0D0CHU8_9AGAR|nr:hypothetical protein GYMLUDRAFT_736406 [Collybiopsis luxurians FD-317 M1]
MKNHVSLDWNLRFVYDISKYNRPALPDGVTQERELRKARRVTIVRAKEGNMIDTSDYAPFKSSTDPIDAPPLIAVGMQMRAVGPYQDLAPSLEVLRVPLYAMAPVMAVIVDMVV